ncbi:coniferyl alcohol acyltransferase-like [Lolium perenne]|uniref:coniferyl alcohol acyltransferase-like n=1 Tax=Lolium perenne TaxID=4522 RepID=UPI003A98F02A
MGWMVDARRRVKAPALVPALRNYFGNITAYALADAAVDDIMREPLAEVAARVRDTITAIDYDTYLQELVDWVEEHKPEHVMEKGILGLGSPTVNQTVFASFPFDTDFGFGEATLALPIAYIWPRLAAALDSGGIFKPLTAEYLGLSRHHKSKSRL